MKSFILTLLIALIASGVLVNSSRNDTSESKNVTDFYNQSGYTVFNGYLDTRTNSNSSLYYMLVSSKGDKLNDSNKPLIIWLQGGPGCSSQVAAHLELGINEQLNK